MSDVWKWNDGDYVEHRAAPGTVWQIRGMERFAVGGPVVSLKYIGGEPITYEQRRVIFDVYDLGTETRACSLCDANPMMVLALAAQK